MKGLIACGWLLALAANAFGQPLAADFVVVNANVRTMNAKAPRAEAIAVRGNEIVAAGNSDAIRKFISTGTRTIDAGGRLVIPGFNDAHVHFMAIGNKFSSIDLREARSIAEVREKVALYAGFLPNGRWILGGQWDHAKWDKPELPSRKELDDLTPDHPVLVYHSNPSVALANSLALRLAGINHSTRSSNEEIERDENGELTGILRAGAIDRVRAVVPKSTTRDWPAVAEAATNYAASLGVTSVQDMSSDDHANVYRELERQGKLKTRIYDCVALSTKAPADIKLKPILKTMVRQGCVKGFSDGDHGESTTLASNVDIASRAGLQVMIHAIGTEANNIALSAVEKAKIGKMRPRIEHAHNIDSRDRARFGRSSVVASVQPYLFHHSPDAQYRRLLDSGARLALGSDAPIADFNPLLGVLAAVSAGPGRAISVEEVIHAYTLGSAYAEFQENFKGSIEAGKLADFVILSDDIFSSAIDDISKAKVVMTVVNGLIVYENR